MLCSNHTNYARATETHVKEQAITNECLGNMKMGYIMNTIFLLQAKRNGI